MRLWCIAVGLTLCMRLESKKLLTSSVSWARRTFGTLVLSLGIAGDHPGISFADSGWDDRNRLAAEVWRTVDDLFFDRSFNNVDWFKLRQSTVRKHYASDAELYASLQDMVGRLGDKYTRYLSPAQYAALLSSSQGSLVGLGVELGSIATSDSKGNRIVVLRVEEGSPAETAGILEGDVVLNVDGLDASKVSAEEVAAVMRGKENTKASVRIERHTNNVGTHSPSQPELQTLSTMQTMDFVIERKPIRVKGVTSALLPFPSSSSGQQRRWLGVIRIRSFSETTAEEVTRAMEALVDAPSGSSSKADRDDKEVAAWVLDLRDNGGGVLQGAVDTCNLFLQPNKLVTFVVDNAQRVEGKQTLASTLDSTSTSLPDLVRPVYVLINRHTASAAEVFSAALRENQRALLVGERSFGKGIIQTLRQISDSGRGVAGGGVTVTIARYETPLHHNIHKIGIAPDIALQCDIDSDAERQGAVPSDSETNKDKKRLQEAVRCLPADLLERYPMPSSR